MWRIEAPRATVTLEVTPTVNEVEITVRRAGRLHGRVVDGETGAPIEAFTVRLGWPEDPSLAPRQHGIGSGWIDPGKSFDATDGVWSTSERDEYVPGEWGSVEVHAPGYAPCVLRAVQVLSAEDTVGLVHVLPRPVALEVALVTASDGAPVPGARLGVTARAEWHEGDLRWDAETDAAGLAVLDGVTPGPLYFWVTHDATCVPLTLGPFEVAAGPRRVPLTVELPARAVVEVTVTDEEGAPLAGRRVRLAPLNVTGVNPMAQVGATTDAEGKARFEAAPAGRWQLALLESAASAAIESEAAELLQTFTIAPSSRALSVELQPRGRVVLRGVVQSPEALPADARVSVSAASGVGPVRLAPLREGRFEVRGVGTGEQTVSVTVWSRASGKALAGTVKIDVPEGATEATVTVVLAPE